MIRVFRNLKLETSNLKLETSNLKLETSNLKLAMPQYGLIGYPLAHSFSQKYFTEKFSLLGLTDCSYLNFEIDAIAKLSAIIKSHPELKGFNVTIPYKEKVAPQLSELDETAIEIGAVNTVKIFNRDEKKILKGYNTDAYGFEHSLKPLLQAHHKAALILGTGGASRAVAFVFNKLGIDFQFVSRAKSDFHLTYQELNEKIIIKYPLIINTSPLGTFPEIEICPALPYEFITQKHLCYDLIYNPAFTLFLQKAKQQGAAIKNGLEMLQLQASYAWEIWNDDTIL